MKIACRGQTKTRKGLLILKKGDLADLPGIVEVAKKHNAKIMVDDAHGIGVMGKNGRGTSEHFGVENDVDLVMGTFSKSFASLGGFVAGEKKVVSYIKHFARSLIFSASITPASVATVLATFEKCGKRLGIIS